jgi:hypothetical protein
MGWRSTNFYANYWYSSDWYANDAGGAPVVATINYGVHRLGLQLGLHHRPYQA